MQNFEKHPEDRQIEILTGAYSLWQPKQHGAAELDLGCGNGDYAVQLAELYPGREIIAADVMIGRLRKVVHRVERNHLENVRILRVEARFLLGHMLPDASLSRVHLLCPDPWPKDRHRAHRLLTSDFTARLHRVLIPGGVFHFSSDDEPYYQIVTRVVRESGLFEECAPDPDLADIKSNFELRWLSQGKAVRHVYFKTLPIVPPGFGH